MAKRAWQSTMAKRECNVFSCDGMLHRLGPATGEARSETQQHGAIVPLPTACSHLLMMMARPHVDFPCVLHVHTVSTHTHRTKVMFRVSHPPPLSGQGGPVLPVSGPPSKRPTAQGTIGHRSAATCIASDRCPLAPCTGGHLRTEAWPGTMKNKYPLQYLPQTLSRLRVLAVCVCTVRAELTSEGVCLTRPS
jgi:hypothetical protein